MAKSKAKKKAHRPAKAAMKTAAFSTHSNSASTTSSIGYGRRCSFRTWKRRPVSPAKTTGPVKVGIDVVRARVWTGAAL